MKQLLQDARTGELQVAEVPAPQLLPGCVLVRVAASLVSAGTERASAEFASKNLLAKAKARPDLVRDVMAKMRRDGLARDRADCAFPPGPAPIGWLQQRRSGGGGWRWRRRHQCRRPRRLRRRGICSACRVCLRAAHAGRKDSRERKRRSFVRRGRLRNGRRDLPARHPHRRGCARRNGRGDRSWVARANHSAVAEGRRLPRFWNGSVAAARRSGHSEAEPRPRAPARANSAICVSRKRAASASTRC